MTLLSRHESGLRVGLLRFSRKQGCGWSPGLVSQLCSGVGAGVATDQAYSLLPGREEVCRGEGDEARLKFY